MRRYGREKMPAVGDAPPVIDHGFAPGQATIIVLAVVIEIAVRG